MLVDLDFPPTLDIDLFVLVDLLLLDNDAIDFSTLADLALLPPPFDDDDDDDPSFLLVLPPPLLDLSPLLRHEDPIDLSTELDPPGCFFPRDEDLPLPTMSCRHLPESILRNGLLKSGPGSSPSWAGTTKGPIVGTAKGPIVFDVVVPSSPPPVGNGGGGRVSASSRVRRERERRRSPLPAARVGDPRGDGSSGGGGGGGGGGGVGRLTTTSLPGTVTWVGIATMPPPPSSDGRREDAPEEKDRRIREPSVIADVDAVETTSNRGRRTG